MAFKMSPIGRNKDPYESMARRGYIAPTQQNQGVGYTKQGIKIMDPDEGQSIVDDAAETNVTWNDWSDWSQDPNNPGQEIRSRKGEGEAKGYYVGTEKMPSKEWEEWLKTPEGQKYTASKNRKETETRKKPEPEKTQIKKDVKPKAQNLSQEIQDFKVYTGGGTQVWDGNKWVLQGDGTVEAQNRQTGGEGKYDQESYQYSDQGVDNDFEGVAEEQINKSAEVMEEQDLDKNLSVEVIDEDKGPKQLSATRQLMNKYMPNKSMAQQKMYGSEILYKENKAYDDAYKAYEDSSKNWINDTTNTYPKPKPPELSKYFHNISKDDTEEKSPNKSITKQTVLPELEVEYHASGTGYGFDKETGENRKLTDEEREKVKKENMKNRSGRVSKYRVEGDEKIPLEDKISAAFQVRGHSVAKQCAKSEGGSGCIKKVGSGWRVVSNKTGKLWPAKYSSRSKAEAALRGYHAG